MKQKRAPVVAVLGHVDHGKTTLLDTIRKTNVASREHGGITQHIGAYQAHNITFIDTPGHVAFAKMRGRGAHVADIALLVVAANDSVQPQTKESIEQIKASGAAMIVVINKIDLPDAKIDKVKSDLAKVGVQVEGFGGDIPFALVSAKQGKGIPELLDLIVLVSEMKGLANEPGAPLEAIVIETKREKARGLVATLLVKKGTLTVGTALYAGANHVGRVRAMLDESGKQVDGSSPSKPVLVLGFDALPDIGSVVTQVPGADIRKEEIVAKRAADVSDFLAAMTEADKKRLTVVLKADTAGSLEAIVAALPDDQVTYVRKELGDISQADILDAKAAKALVVGFNVNINTSVEALARTEKVIFRTYTIIYELLDELKDVLEGLEDVLVQERELGRGQIVAEFPFEKSRIAGTKVVAGRLARGDTIKLLRKDEEIGRAKIKSMKRGKDDVTKVEEGQDCGILFDKKLDFTLGDAIIAVTTG